MKNKMIFVKVDLLLHEKEFTVLRDSLKDFNWDNDYNSLDYSLEEDNILIDSLIPNECSILSDVVNIENKLSSGYILLTTDSLKKLLSL